jgi:hypothetical protein
MWTRASRGIRCEAENSSDAGTEITLIPERCDIALYLQLNKYTEIEPCFQSSGK